MQELIAFLVVAILVLMTGLVAQRRVGGRLGQLILIGLCLRIVGATLRLEVIEHAYGGGSDAKSYFYFGNMYAERMANFDFRFFLGDDDAASPRWWGTQFIRSVTAVVIFLIGNNLRAAFLLFSCFSFTGQYLIVEAFGNAFGKEHRPRLAAFSWLWPSLWFWPSSVGKEAILTLGLGLFTWGYVGKKGSPEWRALIPGLFIAAAIRPHVAMVFGLAMAAGELIGRRQTGARSKILSAVVALVLAAVSIRFGLTQLGLGDADLEGIEEYFEHRSFATEQGGSRIYRARGVLAIPMALVNVFLRPFPWEARGIQIFSGLEIWTFWVVFFLNRHGLAAGLRGWRTNRFARLAAPLGGALAMLYGLAFANLGIIARQRVLVLPFTLSLLAIPRILSPRSANASGSDRVPVTRPQRSAGQ